MVVGGYGSRGERQLTRACVACVAQRLEPRLAKTNQPCVIVLQACSTFCHSAAKSPRALVFSVFRAAHLGLHVPCHAPKPLQPLPQRELLLCVVPAAAAAAAAAAATAAAAAAAAAAVTLFLAAAAHGAWSLALALA